MAYVWYISAVIYGLTYCSNILSDEESIWLNSWAVGIIFAVCLLATLIFNSWMITGALFAVGFVAYIDAVG